MVRIFFRRLLLTESLVYVAILGGLRACCPVVPLPATAVALLLWALLWRLLQTLINLGLSHLRRSLQRPPLSAYGWLRLYWAEWSSAQRLYQVWQLRKAAIRYPPPGQASAPPLILVHGFASNNGFWAYAARQLGQFYPGWIYVPELDPMYPSMDAAAAQISDVAHRARAQSRQENVIVMGHSMGGVAALQYARHEHWRGIGHVVCLGAPFAGTRLADLPVIRRFAPARPDSDLHQRLGAALDSGACAGRPITNIWSWHDTIVAPQYNSHIAGVQNVVLSGVGHLEMAFSPAILDLLATTLVSVNQKTGDPVDDNN